MNLAKIQNLIMNPCFLIYLFGMEFWLGKVGPGGKRETLKTKNSLEQFDKILNVVSFSRQRLNQSVQQQQLILFKLLKGNKATTNGKLKEKNIHSNKIKT